MKTLPTVRLHTADVEAARSAKALRDAFARLLGPKVVTAPRFQTAEARKAERRNAATKAAERAEKRRALVAHHSRKRHATKMQRTPAWADPAAIRAFYEAAARLTAETGIQHDVDHVLPLQGRLVSGLHVETNLQILMASENSRKRNHFEVET